MASVLHIDGLSIQIIDRVLLQNVSFDVDEGEAVLLSGENGVGKSSLLKSILRLENEGKRIMGSIRIGEYGEILNMDPVELQKCRSRIAYIQQSDDYSQMGTVQVRDIVGESEMAFSGKMLSYSEVNDLIDEWLPRRKDNSRIFEAKSRPARFSGGEQRLLSVFSMIATRPDTQLMLIDEPLNNLDYINARHISNLINKVIHRNPRMALLMVSHCRVFPFITREIGLTPKGIYKMPPFECHSCFGEHDEDGFYK